MANAAIVVLAGTESHEGHGRLANALAAATEFHETDGDELVLIFDGAGIQWIPELEDEDHDHHDRHLTVRDETSA